MKKHFIQPRLHYFTQRAFTLIELSVVLVIIGLIVGGVLVGRDLIKSAQVRSQVSQLAQFDAAVGTFVTKFLALPGDITNPGTFGLTAVNGWYSGGNGNQIMEDEDGNYPILKAIKEPVMFWSHLSDAKFLQFTMRPDLIGSYAVDYQYPRALLGNGGVGITSMNDGNLYYFLGITNTTLGGNLFAMTQASTGPILTPPEAFALDSKTDDGLPTTGSVIITTRPAVPDTTSGSCLTSVAANTYNISRTTAACNLLVKRR